MSRQQAVAVAAVEGVVHRASREVALREDQPVHLVQQLGIVDDEK